MRQLFELENQATWSELKAQTIWKLEQFKVKLNKK